MGLFVVIRRRTEAWERDRPLEAQRAWQAHADFMDGLEAEGVALLAGPLEDTGEALIVLRIESALEAERRLAADPRTEMGLLETLRISPWTVRLGSLPAHGSGD